MLDGIRRWFVEGWNEIKQLASNKGESRPVINDTEQWRLMADTLTQAITTHGDSALRARARVAVAHVAALQAAQTGDLDPIVAIGTIADRM